MGNMSWQNATGIPSRSYICGYCGNFIASAMGFPSNSNSQAYVYICHFCGRPTYINPTDDDNIFQSPSAKFGGNVDGISDESVLHLYDEARSCMATCSYTAAVLCCRKLLMNIAVSKGAKEGGQFIKYVEFLSENHYVPPDAKEWVDHIRQKGNEANHEIAIVSEEDTEETISFVEMILRLVYEFPARMRKKSEPIPPTE